MSKRFRNLKEIPVGQLLKFDRFDLTEEKIEGYIVDMNDIFILLERLDPNIYLDGYCVIKKESVRKYRITDNSSFVKKALKLRGLKPCRKPDISIKDCKSIFTTAGKVHPLITIHREAIDNEACNIGKVEKLSDKTVTLKEINPDATWDKQLRRYNFKDITRIDFDGSYEDALWQVANIRRKSRKS